MKERKIKTIVEGNWVMEGAGVKLKRIFGFGDTALTDPFLLLDNFGSKDPADYIAGFPWHPHRGIETITYMLSGKVEHGDSMGNTGVIGPGEIQWMTTGSGIIHQEMPRGDENGLMGGFQLWANLPASSKMMNPRYQGFGAADIPEIAGSGGARIKIICGEVNGVRGPVSDVVVDPRYLDVSVPAESTFTLATPRGYTVFAYVIEGEGYFDPERNAYSHEVVGVNYFDFDRRKCICSNEDLVLFDDGDEVSISTRGIPVRFLLVSGKPIGEPVAWYGPVVMNTQEELRKAFEELDNGTFIKDRKVDIRSGHIKIESM